MKKLIRVLPMLALGGCFSSGASTPYPLYSPAEKPLSAAQIATLAGPIESVDGERVAKHGSTFALEPGCHQVTNQRSWGGSDNMSAVIAHLPGLVFNVKMRAGYSYVLAIGGGAGRVAISMTEQTPNGDVTQEFEPGQSCIEGQPAEK